MPIRPLRVLAAWVAAAAFLVPGAAAAAGAAVAVQRIVPAQPSEATPDRVGVLVFFDFTPASQRLAAQLRQWSADAGQRVVLEREPLATAAPAPLVRAFVVARILGIADAVLPGLFEVGESPLKDDQKQKALAGVFQRWGIDALEFDAAWNSSAADAGVTRARALAERFGVKRAPAIIVNGIWRLVPADSGDTQALLAALDRQVAATATSEARNQ